MNVVARRGQGLALAGFGGMLAMAACGPARAQTNSTNLLGPGWGVRPWLGQFGVTLGASEISEVFGNPTGGINRGAAYDGLTELSLGLDLGKRLGVPGGTFNVSAFQIHGRSESQDNLDTLDTGERHRGEPRHADLGAVVRPGVPGRPVRREGRAAEPGPGVHHQRQRRRVRQHRRSAGRRCRPSTCMPGGRPIRCPRLGVRLRGNAGPVAVLAGVLDDNPGGGPFEDDPQPADGGSSEFNLGTGALFFAELQYRAERAVGRGDRDRRDTPSPQGAGLAGLYKLGAWFDTAAFPDQRYRRPGRAAGRSGQRRHRADAAARLLGLRRRRPDGLEAGPERAALRSTSSPG